jgi:hypothetical protein
MVKPLVLASVLAIPAATYGVIASGSHRSGPVAAWSVIAQTTTPPAASPSVDKPVIDPAAIAALDRMGNYLRSLKSFQIVADQTRDDVLDDGQLVKFASRVEVLVAPNKIRAQLTSDRKDRLYLYDGKSFTLFAPRMNYYATVAAPATTNELIELLDQKYDIQVPLTDMFYWGTPRARTTIAEITAAGDYGPSVIDGTTCQHYAFRQEGLDWQLWIQNGDFALPRKVALTTLSDDARPQFTAVYTWQLAPSFNDAAFTFSPPASAKKITFAGQ